MNELERRTYEFEVRADENENNMGIITGRPVVYDSRTNLGWFDEIIERGALDKTDLKDVRFLVNHDTSKIPLARSRNNNANSTMQLTVDDAGMGIRVNLDIENNTEARNLYSAVKRGDITGMSFMFGVNSDQWDDLESEHPTRRIKEISTVVEVSAVTFPAYQDTTINARNKEDRLDSLKLALDNARQLNSSLDSEKQKRELALEKAKNENRMKGVL